MWEDAMLAGDGQAGGCAILSWASAVVFALLNWALAVAFGCA